MPALLSLDGLVKHMIGAQLQTLSSKQNVYQYAGLLSINKMLLAFMCIKRTYARVFPNVEFGIQIFCFGVFKIHVYSYNERKYTIVSYNYHLWCTI